MDWRATIGLIAGLVTFAATVPYIVAAAKGSIQPSAVTWAGGALLNGIVFAAQISSEPSWSSGLALAATIYCSIVTVLAVRFNFPGFTMLDKVCIALGIVAIAGWQMTNQPLVAVALAILADTIICVPMLVKLWRDPATEMASRFLICAGSSVLGVISSRHFKAIDLAWPVYLVLLNGLIGGLALRGQPVRFLGKQPAQA